MTHTNPLQYSYRRQAELFAPDFCKAYNRLCEVLKAFAPEHNLDMVADHSDLITPYINRAEAEWEKLDETQRKIVHRAFRKY